MYMFEGNILLVSQWRPQFLMIRMKASLKEGKITRLQQILILETFNLFMGNVIFVSTDICIWLGIRKRLSCF